MKRVTFTEAQVAELEKSNKCELIHIMVFLDDKKQEAPEKRDRVDCLIKNPLSMDSLSFLSAMANFENGIERGEYMMDNLWVDGDDLFKRDINTGKLNNGAVRYTASIQAVSQIKQLDAAVAKH